jgi:hypothetical protein
MSTMNTLFMELAKNIFSNGFGLWTVRDNYDEPAFIFPSEKTIL